MNEPLELESGSRLPVLDGWRGLSVVLVIMGHLVRWSSIGVERPTTVLAMTWAVLGVEVFFFISGFVICRGLLRERSQSRRVSFIAFYIRRCFRIIPPITFYLLAALATGYLGWADSDPHALMQGFTFACNVKYCGPLGYHLWSLSAEEQFYAIFPFLFIPALSNPRAAFALLVVGIPLAGLALYGIHEPAAASVLVRDFQCIALGVVSAIFEPAARQLAARTPPAVVIFALLFIGGLGAVPAGRFGTVLGLLVAPAIALVVLRSLDSAFPLRELFLSKAMQFVGKTSYSLYLWQQLATYPYRGANMVFYGGALVALFAVATVSWFAIEQPLIKIGKRISQSIQNRHLLRPRAARAG